jgi:hypothetical protein
MESINNMPSDARLWVYQNTKKFTAGEKGAILAEGNKFISEWSAHGAALKASFDVLYDLFIVIAVDEQQALASGCSIDKSVNFIKALEQKLGLNLFDRMNVAYKEGAEIKNCSYREFELLAAAKKVNENTIVFNNMVTTKSGFEKDWEVPLMRSWHHRVLAQ